MSEGTEPQQLYCRNCGAEVRSGTSFCVSCGASLAPESGTSASAHDAVTSGGESVAEDGSRRDHHDPYEQDSGSTKSIYAEYHLHKRFFQEARDGLIRFSERLNQYEEEKEPSNERLTQNDLADPLLHSQKGMDKAEEYRETLTTPMFRNESSQREAQSMLVELREIQKDVLAFLETFWNKLEATKGHTQFKDEFASWYMDSLEPHVPRDAAHGEGSTSSTHERPTPPPPSSSLAGTLRETLLGWSERFSEARSGSSATTLNQLQNKAINWFRSLPSTPKLVIVGLVLLLILTILSPLALVAAALLLVVSIIALIIRLTQRGHVKGWDIVAVASLVSLFVFSGISNAVYGNGSSGNNKTANGPASPLASMSEAEREYVTRTAEIMDKADAILREQAELSDKCGVPCFVHGVEMAVNHQRITELGTLDAKSLKPPEGYNKSHQAFRMGLQKRNEIVMNLQTGEPIDSLVLNAKDYDEQMIELAPTEGQRFYKQR